MALWRSPPYSRMVSTMYLKHSLHYVIKMGFDERVAERSVISENDSPAEMWLAAKGPVREIGPVSVTIADVVGCCP